MLKIPTFDTFEAAYLAVLEHVSTEYEYTNAPRGNAARECLNVSFALSDPRDRIVFNPARRTNIVFCFAEALWYLWGRNDLTLIGYYAPQLSRFADGDILHGLAYGRRLFRPEAPYPNGQSRWERVVQLLSEQEATKRAVLSIFDPAELRDFDHPDVACTIALQFLLRDDELHAVTYMRGNDAVTGLLCDVFSFTLIQEFTARHLGVRVGSYAHHVGSMHINDVDASRTAQVLAIGQQRRRPQFEITAMPPTSWSDLENIEQCEGELRRDERRLRVDDVDGLGLPPYWQQVVLLFEVYRQVVHQPEQPVAADTLAALDPGYRWLIAHRWPNRMPSGFSLEAGRP